MTKSALKTLAAAVAFAGIGVAFPAQGQGSANPDHIESLESCQRIAADPDRLACLDAAVGAIVSATRQGELRIVDAEDVRKTRRSLFGFSLPNLNLFGGDDDGDQEEDELDMLESTITAVRYTSRDSFVFRIAEGNALWQISNAPSRLSEVEVGDSVVLKKAALGSYFIRIDGKLGVKGRRVE